VAPERFDDTDEYSHDSEPGHKGLRRAARHVLTALMLAVAVGIVAWYVGRPANESLSEAVTLTASASGPAPKVGREAPEFQMAGLDGGVIQLSDFRGKGVWITFWASWCPPCRAENSDIEATHNKYQDDGLVIVAVNLGESANAARGYVERTNLTFLVGLDPTTAVGATYRLVGIPTHFFVDPDGTLREWHIGALSREQMEEKVENILPVSLTRR
jgi:peroxiredoxin